MTQAFQGKTGFPGFENRGLTRKTHASLHAAVKLCHQARLTRKHQGNGFLLSVASATLLLPTALILKPLDLLGQEAQKAGHCEL